MSVASTILWYVILSAIGFAVAPYSTPSGIFTLVQIVLLLGDIGDAEKSNRLIQNFTAALINGGIGWAVGDSIAYIGGIVVVVIVIAKALDRL